MTKKLALAMALILVISMAIGIQVYSKEKILKNSPALKAQPSSLTAIHPRNLPREALKLVNTSTEGMKLLKARNGVGYHDESYFTDPCWCITDLGGAGEYYLPYYPSTSVKLCRPDAYPSYLHEIAVQIYCEYATYNHDFKLVTFWDPTGGSPSDAVRLAEYTLNEANVQGWPDWCVINVCTEHPDPITSGYWGVGFEPTQSAGAWATLDANVCDSASWWLYYGYWYNICTYFGIGWMHRICENTSECGPQPTSTPAPPTPTPTPDPCAPDTWIGNHDGTYENGWKWNSPGGEWYKGLVPPGYPSGMSSFNFCIVQNGSYYRSVTVNVYQDLDAGDTCNGTLVWTRTYTPSGVPAWSGGGVPNRGERQHFDTPELDDVCLDAGNWVIGVVLDYNDPMYLCIDYSYADPLTQGVYYGDPTNCQDWGSYGYGTWVIDACVNDCGVAPPTPTPEPEATSTPVPGGDEDEDEMDE